jgi:hypothetical protein
MEKNRKNPQRMHFKQLEMLLEGAIERHMVNQDSSINIIVKDAQQLHSDPMRVDTIHKDYFSYSLPLSGSTSEALMRMDSSHLTVEDYKNLLAIFKSL